MQVSVGKRRLILSVYRLTYRAHSHTDLNRVPVVGYMSLYCSFEQPLNRSLISPDRRASLI